MPRDHGARRGWPGPGTPERRGPGKRRPGNRNKRGRRPHGAAAPVEHVVPGIRAGPLRGTGSPCRAHHDVAARSAQCAGTADDLRAERRVRPRGARRAGGLMLAWCCDLIVAASGARFRDPTLEMGVCGVEFIMHPWEVGVRQAKEWLFTSDWLTAEEAKALGMVNRVVADADLASFTLDLAARIARKPAFAL